MPLPKPPTLVRCFSSLSSPSSDSLLLAAQALTLLKRNPSHLNSLSPLFTPEAASTFLLKTQNDQTLTLRFLNWAKPYQFLDPKCMCIALHVLTKFKLYKTAQELARDLVVNTADERGDFVFQCLKETYHLCNSSSGVFDLVVKSYSSLNLVGEALHIVSSAKLNGYMPGVLSYNCILDAIIRFRRPFRLAEEVYGEMVASGVTLNVYSYNVLIRGFCKVGNLEMGLSLFREMERIGCLPNVVTYNTVIDTYCKLKRIDDAFALWKSMGLKGLKPNLFTYNTVINGLCRERRMKETSRVLEEMSWNGFVPNEVTYNTLVNGYCKEGNFHQALVLHAEMVRNGLSPDVVMYTSLINSMCKAGNLDRAVEFFDQMRARGLQPNERTYTTLINGFAQQGFLDEAYQVLNEMTVSGFSPSIVTYNALIHGNCILGRMEEANGVLKDMVGRGLYPDVISYSTIIAGFCKYQEVEKAFQMKVEMEENGISPDVITYSSLIQGLCKQKRLVQAHNLFLGMLNAGLAPDELTYTTLMDAYCKDGDLTNAFQLHDEMIQKGFLPDAVTYNVLINGLNKQARTKEAKRLFFKLLYDDSVPDDVTYDTLIASCSTIEIKSAVALMKGFCINGLMNEAERVFESVVDRNQEPSEEAYNVIIHGHCRGGDVQRAYNMYKEMIELGFIPHTVTIMSLVKALFTEGMNEELDKVIENVLKSCKLTDAELAKVLVEVNRKEGNIDMVFNVLSKMAADGLLPTSGKVYATGVLV